jgi:hypothetical protein
MTTRYRQSRRCCGTGRARRAGEGHLEEGCQPEEGRAQGQENRQGCQGQSSQARTQGYRASRREQGREDPGHDRPREGRYPSPRL